jgi:hypothetical protein
MEDQIAIIDLSIYPLKYATSEVSELRKSRGHQFWSLRHEGYVSYTPTGIQKDTLAVSVSPLFHPILSINYHYRINPDTWLTWSLIKHCTLRMMPSKGMNI